MEFLLKQEQLKLVNPINVITGGTKGPKNNPHAPAPCKITAKALGVIPKLATIGIKIGVIIALAPAKVPNNDTSNVDINIVTIIAWFWLFIPTFFIRTSTKFLATLVSVKTSPCPAHNIIIKPIKPKNDCNPLAISAESETGVWPVNTAPTKTQITTVTNKSFPLNAKYK